MTRGAARVQKVSNPFGPRDRASLTGWCHPRLGGFRHALGRLRGRGTINVARTWLSRSVSSRRRQPPRLLVFLLGAEPSAASWLMPPSASADSFSSAAFSSSSVSWSRLGRFRVTHGPWPTRPACRRPPSRSARLAGPRRSGRRPSWSSSKSSSMIDLPSSMMPAMPSQCFPRTFSSRLSNTCSRRSIWPCVSSRCALEGLPQLGRGGRLGELGQRLGELALGVVGVAEFVEERVVQRAGFSHGESPQSLLFADALV